MTKETKIENKKIDVRNDFGTTNLLLVAVLKTLDFDLKNWQKLEVSAGNAKIMFYFENTPELEVEVKKFFTGSHETYKKLYQNLQELKNIIYNA